MCYGIVFSIMPKHISENHPVIFFDGYCNLCNTAVKFVIKHDKEKKFSFVSLQSASGKSLLDSVHYNKQDIDSIVYLENEKVYLRSTAVLKILKKLGKGWQILYVFAIIPAFIRDPVYDLLARFRYKLFGRRKTCALPPPGRSIDSLNIF